jgi:hypothetical protein
MTSSLADQLQQIALAKTTLAKTHTNKDTSYSCFNSFESTTSNMNLIESNVLSGMKNLIIMDARLEPYLSTLFSPAVSYFSQNTSSIRNHNPLDSILNTFFCLLTDYFMLPYVFDIMKRIVVLYKIEGNLAATLVSSILPYHNTIEFIYIIRICRLHKIPLEIIGSLKNLQISISRDRIAQICSKFKVLLHSIYTYARLYAKEHQIIIKS